MLNIAKMCLPPYEVLEISINDKICIHKKRKIKLLVSKLNYLVWDSL